MARRLGIQSYVDLKDFGLTYSTWPLNVGIFSGPGSINSTSTIQARYAQIGKLVHGYYEFQINLSSATADTVLRIDLPVTAFDTGSAAQNVGGGYYYDGSTGDEVGNTILTDWDELRIFLVPYGESFVNANRTCWGHFLYRAA